MRGSSVTSGPDSGCAVLGGAERHLLAQQLAQLAPLHLACDQQVVRARQRLHAAAEARRRSRAARRASAATGSRSPGWSPACSSPGGSARRTAGAAAPRARLRSVMSRATLDAPTIAPAPSRIGETVSEIRRGGRPWPPHGVEMLDPLAAAELGQDLVLLVLQLGRDDLRDRLADHLVGLVAEDPLGAGVPRGDDALQRLADDRVVRRDDDRRQARRVDLRCAALGRCRPAG